ncbi:MAG: hypothetical protein ABSB15_25370 [Bryobacteraceae bacterium]
MTQRPIVGSAEIGSISRRQARNAARAVKVAKAGSIAPKRTQGSTNGRSVSASVIERYLGHFGAGPSRVKKSTLKKSTAKKAPRK